MKTYLNDEEEEKYGKREQKGIDGMAVLNREYIYIYIYIIGNQRKGKVNASCLMWSERSLPILLFVLLN